VPSGLRDRCSGKEQSSTMVLARLVNERRLTYHLTIPRFIDSCEVLGCLLDERKENQTEELIGNTRFDNILDALD
jgi:hypothetical protein